MGTKDNDAKVWHVQIDGQTEGPYSINELSAFRNEGKIRQATRATENPKKPIEDWVLVEDLLRSHHAEHDQSIEKPDAVDHLFDALQSHRQDSDEYTMTMTPPDYPGSGGISRFLPQGRSVATALVVICLGGISFGAYQVFQTLSVKKPEGESGGQSGSHGSSGRERVAQPDPVREKTSQPKRPTRETKRYMAPVRARAMVQPARNRNQNPRQPAPPPTSNDHPDIQARIKQMMRDKDNQEDADTISDRLQNAAEDQKEVLDKINREVEAQRLREESENLAEPEDDLEEDRFDEAEDDLREEEEFVDEEEQEDFRGGDDGQEPPSDFIIED